MKRKQIWWTVGIVLITVVISCAIYWRNDPLGLWDFITMPETGSKVELVTKNGKHSLYIKRRYWGWMGDRVVVVISESGRFFHTSDTATEYHYHGSDPFIYSFENDTLRVYTDHPSQVPPDLHTPIVVIQVRLNWLEFCHLWTTYKQKGLKSIP